MTLPFFRKLPMTTILDEIVAHKRKELALWQNETSIDYWLDVVKPKPQDDAFRFEHALREAKNGLHLIGELKPKSPSAGVLQETPDVPKIIGAYNQTCSAISVLTDAHYFGGGFDLLENVKTLTSKPVLCKDFIIDIYQVLLAVASGADAVLLIMKCLDDFEYISLFEAIRSYGLTPVVEVQNEEELKRACLPHPSVILINNRNLSTFEIDKTTTHHLAPHCPKESLVISASGFSSLEDAAEFEGIADAVLIGTALMQRF
jgi:indole-3-glycerol phosphate synthase/phosphoribosylanthranilate isomerase